MAARVSLLAHLQKTLRRGVQRTGAHRQDKRPPSAAHADERHSVTGGQKHRGWRGRQRQRKQQQPQGQLHRALFPEGPPRQNGDHHLCLHRLSDRLRRHRLQHHQPGGHFAAVQLPHPLHGGHSRPHSLLVPAGHSPRPSLDGRFRPGAVRLRPHSALLCARSEQRNGAHRLHGDRQVWHRRRVHGRLPARLRALSYHTEKPRHRPLCHHFFTGRN